MEPVNINEIQPPQEQKPLKKIKIIISDLHLGKGRTLEDGSTNSLEEFYFGEKLVEFIHYYSTGLFRDYEVELIINGDFLNFLQVDYHGHFLTVITESVALEVMKSIVRGHEKVFAAYIIFFFIWFLLRTNKTACIGKAEYWVHKV